MALADGDLEDTELYARLDTALEKAYLHARAAQLPGLRVEVSTNDTGEIDGVGFFSAAQTLLACVTVYRLEYDCEEPTIAAIRESCCMGPDAMQSSLTNLINHKG